MYYCLCHWFYSYFLVHILGQLLVQLAALLSCHYCNSVLALYVLDVGK